MHVTQQKSCPLQQLANSLQSTKPGIGGELFSWAGMTVMYDNRFTNDHNKDYFSTLFKLLELIRVKLSALPTRSSFAYGRLEVYQFLKMSKVPLAIIFWPCTRQPSLERMDYIIRLLGK